MVALPVVDLAPLRTGDGDLRTLVEGIDRACRDTGFFAVIGHGIDVGTTEAVFAAARRFFLQDDEVKERIAIARSDHHRGYVAMESETLQPELRGDAKEAVDLGLEIDLDDPSIADLLGVHGPNQWPDVPGFRSAILAYYSAVLEASLVTLRGIALALDLRPGFFDRRMRLPMCNLRLLHYPPVGEQADDQLGCGAHSDYGTVTLLATDGTPGLELLNRSGEWVRVAAPEGALIVNLGDLLARWTNDRYVSTTHRVHSPTEGDRYSIPFFVNPDAGAVVAPLSSCVDDEHPPAYEPITASEYLRSRFDDTHDYRAAAG
ncbi:MAG: 2-oxoglutarate and iron-dependent oxygenase domain-containing protein [Actinomycetota bacterium]